VPTVKIGIQALSLRQPLRQAIATAAQLGADGVELDLRSELPLAELTQTALRQLRKLLDDHRLRVSAVSYPTRRGYDDPSDLDRRIDGTMRAMKAASALGAKVVVNCVANPLPDPSDPRREVLVQALTALAMEGNRVGARLAAQTTAVPTDAMAELLGELPESTLGVSLHPAHLLASGQSPMDAISRLGPQVLHAHACDAVPQLGSGSAAEVELGRGTADMPGIVAALESYDYRGWFTIERTTAADPVTDIGNAVAYLRSLVE